MKANKLPMLVLVSVALVSVAVWTSRKEQETGAGIRARESAWLLPALQDTATLNAISEMVFESASVTVAVARTSTGWTLPGRYGYPAQFDRVRTFLKMLSELKIGEALGRDPALLASLELDGPASATSTNALRVILRKTDGSVAAVLTAGKPRVGAAGFPDGRYVAVEGEACLFADSLLSVPQSDLDWMDRDLLDVSGADVQDVNITDPDGTSFRVFRDSRTSDFTVEGLATNEVLHQSSISSVTSLAGYLALEDVADPAAQKLEEFGLHSPAIYALHTFGGQAFTLKVGRGAADTNAVFMAIVAAYTPPPTTLASEAPADDAARREWEAGRLAEEETRVRLARETERLNARLSPWIFKVPSYKFDGLKPGRTTWVQTREEPKPPVPGEEPDAEE